MPSGVVFTQWWHRLTIVCVMVLAIVTVWENVAFLAEANQKWKCVLARSTHNDQTKKWIYLHVVYVTHFVIIAMYVVYNCLLNFLPMDLKVFNNKQRRPVLIFTKGKQIMVFGCNLCIGVALYALLYHMQPSQAWEACVRTDLRFWRVKDAKDSLDLSLIHI